MIVYTSSFMSALLIISLPPRLDLVFPSRYFPKTVLVLLIHEHLGCVKV